MESQVLSGKTAIVTGAASGIGLENGKAACQRGRPVVMLDITLEGKVSGTGRRPARPKTFWPNLRSAT